jgi:carnitine 3-dehydrogenase
MVNDVANKQIRNVAIVGTGLIGASWAAQYLASGFDVIATDPAPNAQANLRKSVDEAWELLTVVGIASGASRDRLTFTTDMKEAVWKADFVQENVPEQPLLKAKVFAQMDEFAPPDSILASSASGITMDVIQSRCKHPERCVIGHPFNPPHVIPLVEVVGGAKTSEVVIERAMALYASIGKKPIRLRKVLPGHVGNRLQAALYREVLYLIQKGVLSVEDADIAVSYGPGLRWGVMGPSLQWHLGGGPGGIQHFVQNFMDGFVGLMRKLEMPEITPALMQSIIDGVEKEANGQSVEQLALAENKLVMELLALRATTGGTLP